MTPRTVTVRRGQPPTAEAREWKPEDGHPLSPIDEEASAEQAETHDEDYEELLRLAESNLR